MSVLWDLFEISINCFQGFIMMYFPFRFLGGKYSERFVKNHGVMFSIILASVISIMNKFTIFEHFLTFAYVIVIFIYAIICLKGSIFYKIYASVFPMVIASVVSVMSSSLFSVLFDKTIEQIIVQKNWQRVVSVIITQLVIFYLINISLRIFSKNSEHSYHLSKGEWMLIIITLLLSILIVVLFVMISSDRLDIIDRIYIVIGVFAVIVINIITFYFVIDLEKKAVSEMENAKLKLQIEYNEQYIENADTEFNLIKKMRHDSKAVYQILGDYINNGEYDKAKEYLKRLTDIADDRIIFVNTDNVFANSIINAKLTMAKNFGIHATCVTVDSFDGIDDMDLCRLLSNMLDNAITATSQTTATEKKLTLTISNEIGTYTFLVCNTIDKSVLKDNPELLSTKGNKETSGLGTKIIRDIAERYNGSCDFYERENKFCCVVMLNVRYS